MRVLNVIAATAVLLLSACASAPRPTSVALAGAPPSGSADAPALDVVDTPVHTSGVVCRDEPRPGSRLTHVVCRLDPEPSSAGVITAVSED